MSRVSVRPEGVMNSEQTEKLRSAQLEHIAEKTHTPLGYTPMPYHLIPNLW